MTTCDRRDPVCNGTTRERRHGTAAEKNEVLAAYDIPAAQAAYYEIDHLVPLAIGGGNVVANLWPQPWAEADQKDVLELELQRRVCHGLLTQVAAQREIANDWVGACRRFVGDRLVAVGEPVQAIPKQNRRQGIAERLKAGVRRLYRSWISDQSRHAPSTNRLARQIAFVLASCTSARARPIDVRPAVLHLGRAARGVA